MIVLGVDPGPTESGYAIFDGARCLESGTRGNDWMGAMIASRTRRPVTEREVDGGLGSRAIEYTLTDAELGAVVFERVTSYGMRVGADVFETVFETGRLYERARRAKVRDRLSRLKVKLHLCHASNAKDADIRQALLDRWGGKAKAVGLKKTPGPLYGVKGHAWAALAVALAYYEGARDEKAN